MSSAIELTDHISTFSDDNEDMLDLVSLSLCSIR